MVACVFCLGYWADAIDDFLFPWMLSLLANVELYSFRKFWGCDCW
jgi:hypothetical protein